MAQWSDGSWIHKDEEIDRLKKAVDDVKRKGKEREIAQESVVNLEVQLPAALFRLGPLPDFYFYSFMLLPSSAPPPPQLSFDWGGRTNGRTDGSKEGGRKEGRKEGQ